MKTKPHFTSFLSSDISAHVWGQLFESIVAEKKQIQALTSSKLPMTGKSAGLNFIENYRIIFP